MKSSSFNPLILKDLINKKVNGEMQKTGVKMKIF